MMWKSLRTGIRAVSIFEAAKGALVLAAGVGALCLLHRDVPAVAEHLVRLSHLDPASRFPRMFVRAATNVTDTRLWLMAGGAGIYTAFRGVEAYGLWHERRWAEWLALISTTIYLPLEVYEIAHRPTWIKVGVFVANMAIAFYMGLALLRAAQAERK